MIRTWEQIETEVKEKITQPTPIGRILTKCNIHYPMFKKLVASGVLEFIEEKKVSYAGPPAKLYKATRLETKKRTD